MSNHNKDQMNALSIKLYGRPYEQLTRDEFLELKADPRWMVAAYGMNPEEWRQVNTIKTH